MEHLTVTNLMRGAALTEFYMQTTRSSRKVKNLLACPETEVAAQISRAA